jgi:hypothetical protein
MDRPLTDRPFDDGVRPPASPARPDSALADSEGERGAIGENRCQPPLLPPSRAPADPPLLVASRPLAIDLSLDKRSLDKRSLDERSFADLSFDDLSFDDLSFDERLLNDLLVAAPAAAPRVEKKCWFCDTPRVVEAAAGRPLADMLSRLGLTESLPVLKRAFCICAWVMACAFMWALPNSLPETEVAPRKFRSCMARFTFENREPARSGAKPPRLNSPKRA